VVGPVHKADPPCGNKVFCKQLTESTSLRDRTRVVSVIFHLFGVIYSARTTSLHSADVAHLSVKVLLKGLWRLNHPRCRLKRERANSGLLRFSPNAISRIQDIRAVLTSFKASIHLSRRGRPGRRRAPWFVNSTIPKETHRPCRLSGVSLDTIWSSGFYFL